MTTNNSITASINQNKKLTPVRVEQVSAASLGFSNIDNTRDLDKPISNLTQAALDLKANIASPTFTGTVSGVTSTMVGLGRVSNQSPAELFTDTALTGIPTAPTANSPTNTTQIATTQFVQTRVTTKINELIGDAGTTLDSLGELADALNDSPLIIINLKAQVNSHVSATDNPHAVTKAQVGLTNVEDKSSATIRGEIVDADIPSTIARDSELSAHTILTNNPHNVTKAQVGLTNVEDKSSATIRSEIVDSDIPAGITRDTELSAHTSLTNNPHSVTKAQVGLTNVEDKSSATIRSEIVDSDIPSTITRDTELSAHTSLTNNPHSVTQAQVGLGRVSNQSPAELPISVATQTALDLKAPLANPALTGNPTAPTQLASDNTTKIATTEYVTTAVAAIVDSAPGSLNTLNELAEALNDSPNQIDNILSSVGQRLVIGNNLSDLNNAATARTNLGLGNVEDTALSTFAGTTNITTLGTITTGTWNGTAIDSPYVGNLPASKINSGVFSSPRLPGLAASDITTGVFSSPRLPGLAAGDITTGVFSSPRLPGLAAADITTGVFSSPRLPGLAAGDITTGTFADARIASSNVTQHSGDITSVGTLTGLTSSGTINVGSTPAFSESRAIKVFDDGTQYAARVSLIGTGDNAGPGLEFVTDGSTNKRSIIRHDADGTTGDYGLNFFTTDGGVVAQRFRIAGNGNVGIATGSDSPASRLHVVQSGHSHLHGIKLEKPDGANTWSIWQNASKTLFFQNSSTATGSHTTRLWLNTSGKLNVTGDLAVGGTILPAGQIDFGERAANDVLIKGESDQNDLTLVRGASFADSVGVSVKYLGSGTGDANSLELATDGGGSFLMDQSGDVGLNQSPTTGIDLTLASMKITGEITSTSAVSRPVQSDETDDSPINNIRRMTQTQYNALNSPDANTLYIIV